MSAPITDVELKQMALTFRHFDGKPFEPKHQYYELMEKFVAEGYLRRVDGRCGFERFKDSMVAFTDAGRRALGAEAKRYGW